MGIIYLTPQPPRHSKRPAEGADSALEAGAPDNFDEMVAELSDALANAFARHAGNNVVCGDTRDLLIDGSFNMNDIARDLLEVICRRNCESQNRIRALPQ
jgi:hypothetical protein